MGTAWHRGWCLNNHNTDEVIGKLLLFFEAQESGKLRAGHRVQWRGDSYLHDGAAHGLDLSGGWFDAGDHLKLVFPLAWSATQVAWAMHSAPHVLEMGMFEGHSNWQWALQTLRHGLDFLLRCTAEPDTVVVQVGEVEADHSACLRAERDATTPRTVYRLEAGQPGADLRSMVAAALAASAAVLARVSGLAELRSSCLQRARELYASARRHPGCYSDALPECKKTYPSDNWQQYMFFAAAWLFVASDAEEFRLDAQRWQGEAEDKSGFPDFSWQSVYFGACAVMFQTCRDDRYREKLQYFLHCHLEQSNGVKQTPCGMTFLSKWGSCRHAAGAAAVLAAFSLSSGNVQNDSDAFMAGQFAEQQVCYILGDAGHSFVIGYGSDPPCRPHHRDSALCLQDSGNWAAFNTSGPNPNALIGGLCGGPALDGTWKDDRADYVSNEVALDYNAALLVACVLCAHMRGSHLR